jgi:hypothetical protein
MDHLASYSGYFALAVIVLAGLVPWLGRLRLKRRAAVTESPIRWHVVVGITATAAASMHTLLALPALGEPAAVTGGALALAPGALAFLVVIAHVGLGLQLRNPKLKERSKKRMGHVATATALTVLALAHMFLLLRSPA